ncbi:unnamed protein product [Peronospora belbahrii]|uniref:Transmembrane protein n=1 Tax=Peronospora belbahrii TaxID=622444 RepID=A0AAU9L572_9STRA|nr:unnamed protein product [Peronospora belbahrii]CAH0521743.1 unnamed protein product [Peronospora belbahrii]
MQQPMRRLFLLPVGALFTLFLFIQLLKKQHTRVIVDAHAEPSVPILLTDNVPSTLNTFAQYLPIDQLYSFFKVSEIAQVLNESPNWSAIGLVLEEAIVATFHCIKLWGTLFFLLIVPILQALSIIGEMVLPHMLTLVTIGADYVSKMDPLYQALMLLLVLFIFVCIRRGYVHKTRLLYVRTKRNMELRYRAFVASLSAKWRIVAILLPHLMFFALSFEALYWLPDATTNVLKSDALFRLLSVGYPLLHSIEVIRQKRLYPKHTKSTPLFSRSGLTSKMMKKAGKMNIPDYEWRPYEVCLKYWVIWSFAVCLIGMVTLFLPAFVTSFFTVPLHWCNIVLIWIHSPFTRGGIALYTLLSPLISPYANHVHEYEATINADAEGKTNFLIRTLVSFRVVPERHVHLAKDLWSQGPALFGLFFLFTPGFVASRGCSLMGFGFPAYVTIGVLGEKQTRRYEWWLAYFSVAIAADYLITALGREIGWLPLFYHAKLLVMVWLQFPYFQGAERIFNASFSSVFVVPERKED